MFRSHHSESRDQLNHDYLLASLDRLYSLLQDYINQSESEPLKVFKGRSIDEAKLKTMATEMSSPPAFEQLCRRFELSEFERNLLLLCAGLEMDARFPDLCAEAHDVNHQYHATFGLALSAFPSPHWSALAPDRPLRYWQLIQLGSGRTLTNTSLHIDERILHYLLGVQTKDLSLTGLEAPPPPPHSLLPSHQKIVDKIEGIWQLGTSHPHSPVIQLCGAELDDKIQLAQAACHSIQMKLNCLNGKHLPLNSEDLAIFIRRLERECILEHTCILIECDEIEQSEPLLQTSLKQLLETFKGFILVSVQSPVQGLKRQNIRIDVPNPLPQEQFITWESSVSHFTAQLRDQKKLHSNPRVLPDDLQDLTAQFNLSTSMIQKACVAAFGQLNDQTQLSLKQMLWNSCRAQARPRLDDLAERIESHLTWDDLVLPPLQKETLRDMIAHVQQKATVYESWGFAAKNRRGLGMTALFSGPSGTGKTLAAAVIANELNLDLYKIELSSVISKYIGETEKNLQRIFDAAERGGVILLFDEADSIFGKRSEVKESKDRYANLEVSYLLQRMESYPGLAILTTNLQSNLDPAFLRRLRFVTQFSLPDATHRTELWRRVFPKATPQQGLDYEKLAQLNAPGGNIRMIALNAAFLAADEGQPIQMKHLLRATQTEYEKLGQSLTSFEIAGWLEAG